MPIMSLRHVSPRGKHQQHQQHQQQQQANGISSERDYNYHIKHSYDLYNNTTTTHNYNTTYYLIDKPYKNYKSKYNNVYLSHNKLFDVTNDRRNHQFLKQHTSKMDTNNSNNSTTLDTSSIPSKLRSIHHYGTSTSSVNACTTTTNTTNTTINTNTTTSNNSNMSKESFENSNIKNRYSKLIHCQSPIIHVRDSNNHISNRGNNNNNNNTNNSTINYNRLNDGFNYLKHIHKSKKYLNNHQYLINNSYDDVISLNKLTDYNHYLLSALHSQDTLSLNKYTLPTYRPENTLIKYNTLENSTSNSNSSLHQQNRHPIHQRTQRQSLLFQKSDLNTSKSQLLNTTTNHTTTVNNQNPFITRIDQNELIIDKSKIINVSSSSTSTTTATTTTTSTIPTNTPLDNLSDHYISTTKTISKLVPPLIGLNDINVNDSQPIQQDIYISNSSNHDNDNDDGDGDGDDLSNPCYSQRDQSISNDISSININHNHNRRWQQSNSWLPKVAMNSNRTKYDEILSTSWNLLTMKNWKSDQELKHKMGLMNNHSNHTHKIGGGFWFREKAIHHTKSLITGRRKIEQSNGHLQQSKGITFSSIVNHCPLINQYLSSNKVLHCQFESVPTEQTELFSLPEAKSKFSIDNSLSSSNRISSTYNTTTTNTNTTTTSTTASTTTTSSQNKVKSTKSIIQSNTDLTDHFNKTNKSKRNPMTDINDTLLTSSLSSSSLPIQNYNRTKCPDTKHHSNDVHHLMKMNKVPTITINDSTNLNQQSKDNLSLKINNNSNHNEYTPSLSSSRRQHSQQFNHLSDYDNGISLKDHSNRELIIQLNKNHNTTDNTTNNTTYNNNTTNNSNSNNNGELSTNDVIKNQFKEKSIIIESKKLSNQYYETKQLSSHISKDDKEIIKLNDKMNIPMTPHTALNIYGKKLTSYEKEEILNFNKIWYLGLSAQKIDAIQGSPSNHGYDDENGGYIKITHDHIAYRFQSLETLGKGSFGRVIRAIDHKSGYPVAIKIIRNKKRFHQQAQVEVAILENLKKADHKNIHNIIHIRDHFTFRNHLCIVFDLLGSNLYDLLRKNDFRGFTIHSLKKITIKLLNCLCLLRKQGIIHCDLKPENILIGLNNPSELKVIDFGSSCFIHQKTYTYIQSRFYRAPEIILGITYGPPIDMWSLGCILPELYTGRPLFPGENENEQLACIMEVLGLPSELHLEKASRRRVFFDSKRTPRYLTNSRGRKRIPGTETIENLVKTVDLKFINLLNQCLTWDPDERITPNEALNHEWIIRENEQTKQNVTFQTLEQTNSENKQKDTIA